MTAVPLLRSYWYIGCASMKLGQAPLAARILEQPLVLFRDQQGVPHALEDRCCHRSAPLSEGTVGRGQLVCQYHGWRFDGGGKVVEIPSLREGQRIPAGCAVKSFPCVERDAYVWVWMGEGAPAPPPSIPELPRYRWIQGSTLVACNALLAIENFFDPAHTSFLHRWTHPNFVKARLFGLRTQHNELRVEERGMIAFGPPTASEAEPLPERAGLARFVLPYQANVEFSLPWQRHVGYFFYVPVGPRATRVEWLVTKYLQLGRKLSWRRRHPVLEQDRVVLERIQQWHDRGEPGPEPSVEADSVTLLVRKIITLAADGRWEQAREGLSQRRLVSFRS